MGLGKKSAAWIGLGALLGSIAVQSFTAPWPAPATVALGVLAFAALAAGFVYAYRRTKESKSGGSAFIVGKTNGSTFIGNETEAPVFQRGDSVNSKYKNNRSGA